MNLHKEAQFSIYAAFIHSKGTLKVTAMNANERSQRKRPRETFEVESLRMMAEKLDAMPDASSKRALSRAEAVRFLEPQIERLRLKNYTTKELCAALAEVGLRISPQQFVKIFPAHKSRQRTKAGADSTRKSDAQRAAPSGNEGGSMFSGKETKKTTKCADKGGTSGEGAVSSRGKETPGFAVRPDRLEI